MPDIYFEKNPETNQLKVTIETERLIMQSTTHSHFSDYKNLFTMPENMYKVMDGNPWSADKIGEQHHQWVARWNNDSPFSSLAILKNDTDEFIGHVLLGDGDQPGSAELAYVFDKKFWGKGYGKEAIPIMVQEYAPELVKRDYRLTGKKFTRIEATARTDNQASIRLLLAAGMSKFSEKLKWGKQRQFFFVNTIDLIKIETQNEIFNEKCSLIS
ncbi:GNAT family N-acetyltransferase [Rickettsiella endosymbiont of Aleochara curtula]|uniref:GNAT family N-acetyltransferase n=1 Tax=Rickettsiella endosymbiont of Aleochara curtula TaxID=3077936 RepID=UPI00313DD427